MLKIRVIGTQEEIADYLKFLKSDQEFIKQFNLLDYSQPYKSRKRDDEYLIYLSLIKR